MTPSSATVAEETPFSTEIRPGVVFPDWTAVTSDRARSALNDILQAFGVEGCWRDFTPLEDRCRQAIMEDYLHRGRPPTLSRLAAKTGLSEHDVREALARLKGRDLVLFDEQAATI